eukprot:g5334.t1
MGSAASLNGVDTSQDVGDMDKAACVAEVQNIRRAIADYHTEEARRIEVAQEKAARVSTGKIKLVYERYDDLFDITNGEISVSAVDEEYCLTDIMPGATIELSTISPQERIDREIKGIPAPFVDKTKSGQAWQFLFTYSEVSNREPKSYFVIVFQDPAQREADLAKTRERMAAMEVPSDKRIEGCSCLEGNPCSEGNKYACLDWNNRFAVALSHASEKQKKSVLGM